jgi:hypothetical protein
VIYLGDFVPGRMVRRDFNTQQSDGTLVTLTGSPAAVVYKDGSTAESTAGVSAISVDFDARTGLHQVTIDTSADTTFYSAGSDFEIVLATGTAGGINLAGRTLGKFSLANRSSVVVAGGTVAAGATTTQFTAAIAGSSLSSVSGEYDGMKVFFPAIAANTRKGVARLIQTYTVAGGVATINISPGQPFAAAPPAGDTFIIG